MLLRPRCLRGQPRSPPPSTPVTSPGASASEAGEGASESGFPLAPEADTQAVITAAVMAVVMVIGVGTLTAVAVLFPWRLRSSFILRLLRPWSILRHRSFMLRPQWFMPLLRWWSMHRHRSFMPLRPQWSTPLRRSSTLQRLFIAPLGLPSVPVGRFGCLCFELSGNQFLLD
jgi:hypothetical protein